MDESSRIPDDLYRAVRPMLAVSGGHLILLTTPFGKRGFFWEAWDKGKDWERYTIPWQLCPWITPEFIEEERAESGELWVQQEYECVFLDAIDAFFPHDLIRSALADDIEPLFGGVSEEAETTDPAKIDIEAQEAKIQSILKRMVENEQECVHGDLAL